MIMSSYPPGVTGNEFEIAGPDYEQEEERTCDSNDVTIKVWRRDSEELMEVEVIHCPFTDGEVTIFGYQSERWWKCPFCGIEHFEDDDE